MNTRLLLPVSLILLLARPGATAQVVDSSAQWTWMGGDNTNLDRGLVGQTGVPALTNRISSRWMAHGWTGNDGRLYVFGGEYNNGNNGIASGNTLNDFWRYDISTGMWELIGGIFSNNTNAGFNVPGIYGTLKVPAAANWPGSRRGGTTWKDAAGNFWMFGGWGGTTPSIRGYFNDLWKYDVTSGEWTWVSGANGFATAGTYGTKGVAAATNIPGGRGGYAYHGGNMMSWTDASGNMWLFGGYGYDATGSLGSLNDLWKYNPAADTWTWVNGTSQADQPGVYGTKGVADAANTPGGRYSSFNWTDPSGKFWLYGGVSFDRSGTYVYLEDLWMYNPATNMWTWMSGSSQSSQPAVYGQKGLAAATNSPGARYTCAQNSAWVDILGKLWLYGGRGFARASNATTIYMSDLWQYDPATNMWTWMKGPDPATAPHLANRGTQGVRDPANYPPGKLGHLTWRDLTGNFWMLGGVTYSVGAYPERPTSDLWRLDQVIVVPKPPEYTNAPPHICIGDTMTSYTYEVNIVPGATAYAWEYTGTGVTLGDDTTALPQNQLSFYPGATSGSLRVRALNQYGASSVTDTSITVQAIPKVDLGPDIDTCGVAAYQLQSGYTYGAGTAYTWSTGETTPRISVATTGRYWLTVTEHGCSGSDTADVSLLHLAVDLGADTSLCDRDLPIVFTSLQPAGVHYLWNTGLSDTILTVSRPGRYWLEVSYKGACRVSDTVAVDVVPTPAITLGSDSIICEQFPARIGFEMTNATYSWSTGAVTPYITAAKTGMYILSMTIRGCTVSDTIQLTALPVPDVNLGGDRDICEASTMILDGTTAGGVNYRWSTGAVSTGIEVSEAGTYWVRVVTEHQCVGADTVTLTHYPKPYVSLGADTVVCREDPLLLQPFRLNTDYIAWSDGSRGDVLSVVSGGIYIAEAVNKCGTDEDTIAVQEIYCDIWVPGAFTPNNDGKNDVFRISGNTGRISNFSMSVYNRWGELVFHTNDKAKGWDGRQGNTDAALGTYAYLIEYNIAGVPHLEKGTVALVR